MNNLNRIRLALCGRSLSEAKQLANDSGYRVRFAIVDDKSMSMTNDLVPNRINLVMTDGIISDVQGLG